MDSEACSSRKKQKTTGREHDRTKAAKSLELGKDKVKEKPKNCPSDLLYKLLSPQPITQEERLEIFSYLSDKYMNASSDEEWDSNNEKTADPDVPDIFSAFFNGESSSGNDTDDETRRSVDQGGLNKSSNVIRIDSTYTEGSGSSNTDASNHPLPHLPDWFQKLFNEYGKYSSVKPLDLYKFMTGHTSGVPAGADSTSNNADVYTVMEEVTEADKNCNDNSVLLDGLLDITNTAPSHIWTCSPFPGINPSENQEEPSHEAARTEYEPDPKRQRLKSYEEFPHIKEGFVHEALFEHFNGTIAITEYKKTGVLSTNSQHCVAECVLLREIKGDIHKKVTSTRLIDLASQIAEYFPTECASTYYTPFQKNTSGKRYAGGKLIHLLYNIRKRAKKVGLPKKSSLPATLCEKAPAGTRTT